MLSFSACEADFTGRVSVNVRSASLPGIESDIPGLAALTMSLLTHAYPTCSSSLQSRRIHGAEKRYVFSRVYVTRQNCEAIVKSRSVTDALGRVYEQRVYEVVPTYGSPDSITSTSDASGNYIKTQYWYDDAGNLIKQATAGVPDHGVFASGLRAD